MFILRTATTVLFLAILAYVAWTFYTAFRAAPSTDSIWNRLLGAARNSATILWSKFVIFVAAITAQLDNFADLIGAPEMKDFINQWVGNPKIIAGIMMVIAAITITARRRTL